MEGGFWMCAMNLPCMMHMGARQTLTSMHKCWLVFCPCFVQGFNTCHWFSVQCVRIRGHESWMGDFEYMQWTYHAWCTWGQDRHSQVCTSVDLGLLPMLCPGLQHMSLIYTTDQCVRIRGHESWTWDFECVQWTYHAWCTWGQDRHKSAQVLT